MSKTEGFFSDFKELVKKHFSTEKEQKFATAKLKDGTMIYYDGETPMEGMPIFVLDENQNPVPAADGVLDLEDGSQIEVKGGVIAAIKPAETPTPEATQTVAPQMDDAAPITGGQAKTIIESIVKESRFASEEAVKANEAAIEVLTTKLGEVLAKMDEQTKTYEKHNAFFSDFLAKFKEEEKEEKKEETPVPPVQFEKVERFDAQKVWDEKIKKANEFLNKY